MQTKDRVILALDNMNLDKAIRCITMFKDEVHTFKVHILVHQIGPTVFDLLRRYTSRDLNLFADMKLNDTPDEVAQMARKYRDLGANMLTVHAEGGEAMVRAAVENGPREIFAVTVLTSKTDEDCSAELGIPLHDLVFLRAREACRGGAHGVVSSGHELGMLERYLPQKMLRVVTGVRSAGVPVNDQQRVMTPREALSLGANFIVVGREITQADDPRKAMDALQKQIADL